MVYGCRDCHRDASRARVARIKASGTIADEKHCPTCGVRKPASKFKRNTSNSNDGLSTCCRDCERVQTKNRYERKKADTVVYAVEKPCGKCHATKAAGDFYDNKHFTSDGLQSWCKECIKESRRDYFRKNKQAILEKERQSRRVMVLEMVAAYGGECECCRESRWEFLTLDHKFGNGGRHRAAVGGSRAVFKEVRRLGYPRDQYRLLCYNCNCVIGRLGYCPHEREKSERVE